MVTGLTLEVTEGRRLVRGCPIRLRPRHGAAHLSSPRVITISDLVRVALQNNNWCDLVFLEYKIGQPLYTIWNICFIGI